MKTRKIVDGGGGKADYYILPFWQSYPMYFSFKGCMGNGLHSMGPSCFVAYQCYLWLSLLTIYPLWLVWNPILWLSSLEVSTQCLEPMVCQGKVLGLYLRGRGFVLYILPSCVSHRCLHLRGSYYMTFFVGMQYMCSWQPLEHSADLVH